MCCATRLHCSPGQPASCMHRFGAFYNRFCNLHRTSLFMLNAASHLAVKASLHCCLTAEGAECAIHALWPNSQRNTLLACKDLMSRRPRGCHTVQRRPAPVDGVWLSAFFWREFLARCLMASTLTRATAAMFPEKHVHDELARSPVGLQGSGVSTVWRALLHSAEHMVPRLSHHICKICSFKQHSMRVDCKQKGVWENSQSSSCSCTRQQHLRYKPTAMPPLSDCLGSIQCAVFNPSVAVKCATWGWGVCKKCMPGHPVWQHA